MCTCTFTEIVNEAGGNVKGFVLAVECNDCKLAREASVQAAAERKALEDAKIIARESFKQKLIALGTFTEEEINSILG